MFEDCYRRMNENIKPDKKLVTKTIGLACQNKRRSKLVPAIILAVLIVMISATALAAKVTTGAWLGFLIEVDNPVDLQELLLKPGESIVYDDYRITLQSAVGDGTAYYILLDLDKVSGTPLYDYPLRPITEKLPSNIYLIYDIHAGMDSFWNRVFGYVYGVSSTAYRVDDENDPTKATFIISSELSYSGRAPKWIEFNITSINSIIQTGEYPDQRKIADGSWKFIVSNQTDIKAVTYKIDDCQVRITPLSISMKASSAPFDLDPRAGIQVELKDGSIINIPHIGISYGSNGLTSDWQLTALFDTTIEPSSVAAIILEEERIALK